METSKIIKGYELLERIGSGGFGVVHRAYQATVGREVAIKIILPHFANDPSFIRRFETEAQIIARLEHPFIVPLYDYWRDPEGAYLVMRWLRGGNLRDALAHGPFGLEAAALFMDQVTSALAMAHRNEIVHRDLKPANILLDEDGNAYLSDFGIAKDTSRVEGTLTGTGMVLGSPDYLSPEQARSEPVTPQTDIYSLGVVLYEVLTGQHPFPNVSSVERMYKHLNEPIPLIETLPPEIADGVNAIIQKATAKDPAHRYADVLAIAADFRRETALSQRAGENIVEQLTLREQEILQMIVEGCSNKDIAQHLFITIGTVKWHVRQLYQKLRVRGRVQAIVRARELNLIVSDTTTESTASESTFIALPEPENPYKGLRSFQVADARDFFGRERLIQRLVKRLGEHDKLSRFLGVIGPSGSGKSSVVKAGLVPALWRGDLPGSEHWFVVEMVPGAHPLDELEIALTRVAANQAGNLREHLERDARGLVRVAGLILPDDGSDLVIIVDQFEEIFTLVDDEAKRTHFLVLLHTAVTDPRSRVRVIMTLRADFYDRPLHYPDFGELVRSRMETVMPLSADELEAAITQPAARVGVSFEPGLVATITSDVHYQPGALPLLQYALTELFEQRNNHTLTHEAYQSLGGATGALAKRAEELYHEQDEGGQEAIRQMFLRLVSLGEGAEDTRRRVSRSELLAVAGNEDLMDEAVDIYAAYRLVTLDHDPLTRSPTVEIAHEAILREWERLRSWLNDCRHDIRQQRLLAAAAAEWFQAEHDPSYLLTGSRLTQFEGWAGTTQVALTQNERAYLEASIAERQCQENTERERQTHELELAQQAAESAQQAAESARQAEQAQRSAAHRLRYLVTGLAVFLVVAVVLSVFAFKARSTAQEERDNAQRSANESQSLALASGAREASLNQNPDLALALAVEANVVPQALPQVKTTLADIALAPGTRRVFTGHTSPVMAVAISPDGRYLLTGAGRLRTFFPILEDNTMRLWDLQTGKEIRRFEGFTDAVWSVAFSPDGRTVFSGSADGKIYRWDLATGQIIRRYSENDAAEFKLVVSPDGQSLLVGDYGGRLRLFDVETGKELRDFQGSSEVYDLSFSPDGRTVYSSGVLVGSSSRSSGLVAVWDVATGNQVRSFEATDTVMLREGPTDCNAAFSPDGRTVLGVQGDQLVLWDTETGQVIRHFNKVHGGWVTDLAISPDGHLALTASEDATLILWNLDTGELLRQFRGQQGSVMSVAFTPDGLHAVSGAVDGTVRLWDLDGGNENRRLRAEGFDQMWGLAVSPDGRTALTGVTSSSSNEHALVLWNLDTGEPVRTLQGHTDIIRSVAYSPDSRRALSLALDGKLKLWDLETGQEIREYVLSITKPSSVAFSPDGRTALLTTEAIIYFLNVETGEKIHSFLVGRSANDVIFSPDGRTALVGAGDNTVTLYDLETGTLKQSFVGHQSGVQAVAFSPDGRHLLSGGADPFMILWDAATGVEIRRMTLPTSGTVNSLVFSPDGQTALSGMTDGLVILWDVASGEPRAQFTGHSGAVWRVRFSPDGNLAFSTGIDGTLRQWALPPRSADEWLTWTFANRHVRDLTGKEQQFYDLPARQTISSIHSTYALVVPVQSTPAPIPTAAVMLTPTPAPSGRGAAQIGDNRGEIPPGSGEIWTYTGRAGELVIIEAIADQPTTGVYDLAQQLEKGLLDPQLAVRASDGSLLAENDDFRGVRDNNARLDAILPQDGTYTIEVRSYRNQTGGAYTLRIEPVQVVRERSRAEYHDGQGVAAVAISPDGQRALSSRGANGQNNINATEKQDKSFTLWDISGDKVQALRSFNQNGEAHAMSVTGLTFCTGGSTALSASWDGSMALWNLDTGQVIQKLVGHQYIPYPVCTPDGKTIVSGSYDGTLRVWDLATGQELRRLDLGAVIYPFSVVLAPDGRTAILGSDAYLGLIQWDIQTGGKWQPFADYSVGLGQVAISPDGRWVAAVDPNSDIILLDATTRQEVRHLTGHTMGFIGNLVFTPDSQRLFSGGLDGTLRLWDVRTGREIARFLGHQSGIWTIGLSADGRTAVSGSFDGTMRVWDVPELPDEEK